MTLLDFVRYDRQLIGTKIGCREGDCGACTLLMGSLNGDSVEYKSLTSCITPLGNAHGKHIVSIEGLNLKDLSPYQQAMVDESGTQCGFCTVGFIVSFAGECLSQRKSNYESIISAIDGNICRCTGYKSIERASRIIEKGLKHKDLSQLTPWLVEHKYLPPYFTEIPERLKEIKQQVTVNGAQIIGGGTDLYVQRPDEIFESEAHLVSDDTSLVGIMDDGEEIHIGASTNTTQIMESELLQSIFPDLRKHMKLVSSTPIRNIATLAGNLVNASPIGDLSIFFLALDSKLEIQHKNGNTRFLKLNEFFHGYKDIDLGEEEFIQCLSFPKPTGISYFNFEKVCKRKYLDIATVNTAMSIQLDNGIITSANLSAGGVAPIPKYLSHTSEYLISKPMEESTIQSALDILQEEISPISDVRGSADYKRLLLRQLVFAHFMECFPETIGIKALT